MEIDKNSDAQRLLQIQVGTKLQLQKTAGEHIKSLQENIIDKQAQQINELKDETIIPEFAALRQQLSNFESKLSSLDERTNALIVSKQNQTSRNLTYSANPFASQYEGQSSSCSSSSGPSVFKMPPSFSFGSDTGKPLESSRRLEESKEESNPLFVGKGEMDYTRASNTDHLIQGEQRQQPQQTTTKEVKKRGRKSKISLEQQDQQDHEKEKGKEGNKEVGKTEPKKRGRKPKGEVQVELSKDTSPSVPEEQAVDVTTQASSSEPSISSSVEADANRGPGRPQKNAQSSPSTTTTKENQSPVTAVPEKEADQALMGLSNSVSPEKVKPAPRKKMVENGSALSKSAGSALSKSAPKSLSISMVEHKEAAIEPANTRDNRAANTRDNSAANTRDNRAVRNQDTDDTAPAERPKRSREIKTNSHDNKNSEDKQAAKKSKAPQPPIVTGSDKVTPLVCLKKGDKAVKVYVDVLTWYDKCSGKCKCPKESYGCRKFCEYPSEDKKKGELLSWYVEGIVEFRSKPGVYHVKFPIFDKQSWITKPLKYFEEDYVFMNVPSGEFQKVITEKDRIKYEGS